MDLFRLELLLTILGIDILDLQAALGSDLIPTPEPAPGEPAPASASDSGSVKQNDSAKGVSRIFQSLVPGKTVTVSANSGNTFGPATVVNFDAKTSTVTLTEADAARPSTTKITVINSEDIESVSFTN